MRGVLLNPTSGFTTNTFSPGLLSMSVQEMAFWMWRVAAIDVECVMSASVDPDSGSPDFEIMVISDRFYCPVTPSDPLSPVSTEFEQCTHRVPFCSVPLGTLFPIEIIGENSRFGLSFGGLSTHNPGLPAELGWSFPFRFQARIGNGAGSFAEASTDVSPNIGGTVLIEASNPIINQDYEHQPAYYLSKTSDVESVSFFLRITQGAFYPWKDSAGVPLYDTSNGEYA